MLAPAHSTPTPPRSDVLVLCPPTESGLYRTPLIPALRVETTASADFALQAIIRHEPSLLIVDGDAPDGGAPLCESVRRLPTRPAVLVTPTTPTAAGLVIDKCDSILLKPFAPKRLIARVLMLFQHPARVVAESDRSTANAWRDPAKAMQVITRGSVATVVEWPNTQCPYCNHTTTVCFDEAEERRMWFACPACRKTWIAEAP